METQKHETAEPREYYEVAIWCSVKGRDEDEVKEIVYKYCQQLKESFDTKLVVKAVEVGLKSFHPS